MTRTIKARELGDGHIGARIRTTSIGWAMEGELAEVQAGASDYHVHLRAKGDSGLAPVLGDADVTILEEAPIRHPDEPTGLGAVVEADTWRRGPARWIASVDIDGCVRWFQSWPVSGTWYSWREVQGAATGPIRVLSKGVHLGDGSEPETPEVYEGMVLTEWPENDEHLRGWEIEDCNGGEWRWDPKEGDQPGKHWYWASMGFYRPSCSPWRVLRKANV